MASKTHLVVLQQGPDLIKLVKVWFGADGSYYVTSPYHSAPGKAALFRATVNYALHEQTIPYDAVIDFAALDDDEKRLKLSHHTTGWIQFSGDGIASGFDEHGMPKGVAVKSWPLKDPVRGPAFAAIMCGLESFERCRKVVCATYVLQLTRSAKRRV